MSQALCRADLAGGTLKQLRLMPRGACGTVARELSASAPMSAPCLASWACSGCASLPTAGGPHLGRAQSHSRARRTPLSPGASRPPAPQAAEAPPRRNLPMRAAQTAVSARRCACEWIGGRASHPTTCRLLTPTRRVGAAGGRPASRRPPSTLPTLLRPCKSCAALQPAPPTPATPRARCLPQDTARLSSL